MKWQNPERRYVADETPMTWRQTLAHLVETGEWKRTKVTFRPVEFGSPEYDDAGYSEAYILYRP